MTKKYSHDDISELVLFRTKSVSPSIFAKRDDVVPFNERLNQDKPVTLVKAYSLLLIVGSFQDYLLVAVILAKVERRS